MPVQFLIQETAAGGSLLEQGMLLLANLGFFQVVIPFILIFAVIFAILEKSKILGEGQRQVNSVIALVIALATTGAVMVTGVISKMIPLIVLAIIVLFLFFLIYGLFGGTLTDTAPAVKIGLGIAVAIAVALIFLYSANLFEYVTGEIMGLVLLIAVVVAVIGVIAGISPAQPSS